MKRFPQYKGRDFYLSGESYAGTQLLFLLKSFDCRKKTPTACQENVDHILMKWFVRAGYYVPELSKLIYENNKNLPDADKINFKGFMVGNPVIDTYSDNWGYIDFLYYHAMISDQLYAKIKVVCNFQRKNATLSDACVKLLYYNADEEQGEIDPYSVYAPACTSNTTFGGNFTGHHPLHTPHKKLFNPVLGHFRREEYDPCTYDYSLIYFNRPDVQKAMHANTTGIPYPWVGCSDPLFLNWKDSATTVLPIYQELLEAGLQLWVFRCFCSTSLHLDLSPCAETTSPLRFCVLCCAFTEEELKITCGSCVHH